MPLAVSKDRKYVAMRVIGEWVDYHSEQERRLRPRYGEVMVGSADFDHLLKTIVGMSYLRILRRGGTPDAAYTEAVKDGTDCVARWNKDGCKTRVSINSSYELQRWDKAGEVVADEVHLKYLTCLGLVSCH